jgi:hypothetical protein
MKSKTVTYSDVGIRTTQGVHWMTVFPGDYGREQHCLLLWPRA